MLHILLRSGAGEALRAGKLPRVNTTTARVASWEACGGDADVHLNYWSASALHRRALIVMPLSNVRRAASTPAPPLFLKGSIRLRKSEHSPRLESDTERPAMRLTGSNPVWVRPRQRCTWHELMISATTTNLPSRR